MNGLNESPNSITAEKAVVSMVATDASYLPRAKAEGITSDSFYWPASKIVWRGICDHIEEHGEVDPGLFVERLTTTGDLERCGGLGEITDYIYHPFAPESRWPQYVQTVKDKHALRIARESANALSDADNSQDAIDSLAEALEKTREACSPQSTAKDISDCVDSFVRQWKADYKAGDIPGLHTGMQDLDDKTGGMRPGALWVIAGRPSMGKSVLMMQYANECLDDGKRVVVFSLEMMAEEYIARLIACGGLIGMDGMTKPRQIKGHELAKMKTQIERLKSGLCKIDDTGGQTIEHIEHEAKRIRDSEGTIDLVVVDYLQLIKGGRARNETREQEIARCSRGLKDLAKQLDCPVIAGSQLNDDGKVRESRAIEQDADVLLCIADDGLKLAKNRNGEKGVEFHYLLDGGVQKFK